MPDFAYVALDPAGKERRGRISAANDDAARERLTGRSFYVVSCEPAQAKTAGQSLNLNFGGRKLGTKQLTLFTRQLSSLIQVSPLEEALRTISRQNEKEQVRDILGNVHSGVLEGQRLSEAMKREPKSFPPLYRAMVSAGETSGSLPQIAERLANLLERQAEMRGKLIGALAYPIVLAIVAMLVVVGLMVSVVPRVVEQFDNVDQQLPLITRIVIGISAFLAAYWWVIALLMVALGVLLWRMLKEPKFRYGFDAMLLRLPLLGRLLRDLHAARMARTMSTMVASRLPVLEGLRLTSQTVRNSVLKEATEGIVEAIRGGGSLSGAMRSAGVFPPLLVYLAASGESSGQLDTMLERAADYLEREFDNFTSTALSLLEPLIIVVMGGMVAVIILSILLPILQLQNFTGA
ncbi:type II secretion system inner membrane protein GspF [Novosphingopyxis sp. YJ-S2-01]|uniref:type II secretion system inner membrane protein GspF n=1 Tax=Novosphingopyxis sp. YJ-S2-01 TaxID=2794021 RepID=UPI000C68CA6B|nr:type II secretion system inner membrane protein GspF [Novosphingopyxis sp. YJ-S2-01]MAC11540.1 type II secretion system protein GspF [Sphingorhabdus sp.]MBH9538209.1 type II secretion system inner membrane protein GspF [Novosphingopyxis sp. YJ-S2-01]